MAKIQQALIKGFNNAYPVTFKRDSLVMHKDASETDYDQVAVVLQSVDNMTRWGRADLIAQRSKMRESWGDEEQWAMERFNMRSVQQVRNEVSIALAWPPDKRRTDIMTIRDHALIRFAKALNANRDATPTSIRVSNEALQDFVVRWVEWNIEHDTWLQNETGYISRRFEAIKSMCKVIRAYINAGLSDAEIFFNLKNPELAVVTDDVVSGSDELEDDELEQEPTLSPRQQQVLHSVVESVKSKLTDYLTRNPNIEEVAVEWKLTPILRGYQPTIPQSDTSS